MGFLFTGSLQSSGTIITTPTTTYLITSLPIGVWILNGTLVLQSTGPGGYSRFQVGFDTGTSTALNFAINGYGGTTTFATSSTTNQTALNTSYIIYNTAAATWRFNAHVVYTTTALSINTILSSFRATRIA